MFQETGSQLIFVRSEAITKSIMKSTTPKYFLQFGSDLFLNFGTKLKYVYILLKHFFHSSVKLYQGQEYGSSLSRCNSKTRKNPLMNHLYLITFEPVTQFFSLFSYFNVQIKCKLLSFFSYFVLALIVQAMRWHQGKSSFANNNLMTTVFQSSPWFCPNMVIC